MQDRSHLVTRIAAEFQVLDDEAVRLIRIAERHAGPSSRVLLRALAVLTFFVAAAFLSSALVFGYTIVWRLFPSIPPPASARTLIIALSAVVAIGIASAVRRQTEFAIVADAVRQVALLRRCASCDYDFAGLDASPAEFCCPECGRKPVRLPPTAARPGD